MAVLQRAAHSGELEGKPVDVLKDCLRITHEWVINSRNDRVIGPLQDTLRHLIYLKESERGQAAATELSAKALSVSEESMRVGQEALDVSKKSYRLNWWILWVAVATLIAGFILGIIPLLKR